MLTVLASATILLVLRPPRVQAADTADAQHHNKKYDSDSLFESSVYEYDSNILDPHSVHGTPYGGFGRATKSRLAALPLHLPPISEKAAASSADDDSSKIYTQVRDDSGRLFACRVYLEDELDPSSLNDSMFDAPKLRSKDAQAAAQEMTDATTAASDDQSRVVRNTQGNAAADSEHQKRGGGSANMPPADTPSGSAHVTNPQQQQQQPSNTVSTGAAKMADADAGDPLAFAPAGARRALAAESAAPATMADDNQGDSRNSDDDQDGPAHEQTNIADKALVKAQLAELEDVCGQIHRGYWSYEWCFEKGITQYHIEYNAETNAVQVEQVTNLGTFQSRRYQIDELPEMPPNEWAEDMPELARVVDYHNGGDLCKETGEARQSYVHLQCCSGKVIARRRGMLHKDGHPLASDIAAFLDVHEESDKVCVYNVTVCTPLLCGEEQEAYEPKLDSTGKRKLKGEEDKQDAGSVVSKEILSVLNALSDTSLNEGEAFRSILDRTLANLCLQTNSGGWWIYEYCHKEQIRQFHEVTAMRKSSSSKAAVPARIVETEHILGRYNPIEVALEDDDIAGDGEEWKLVVNATVGNKVYGDGNGAHYEIEYSGGDVCDHSDVTESAIVAGGTGAVGGLERGSTVRFYCGKDFGITVSEDHTCHYIVTVLVPALCGHPLFRAPISKKQIMKCLPVEED